MFICSSIQWSFSMSSILPFNDMVKWRVFQPTENSLFRQRIFCRLEQVSCNHKSTLKLNILAGHPALIGRHRPFPVTHQAAERWLHHMQQALDSTPDIDDDSKIKMMNFSGLFSVPKKVPLLGTWLLVIHDDNVHYTLIFIFFQAHCIFSGGWRWAEESKPAGAVQACSRKITCHHFSLHIFWSLEIIAKEIKSTTWHGRASKQLD